MKNVKINFIIPNFITSMNMLFGFMSIITAIRGEFLVSAWLLIFAIVADGIDGKAARLLNGFSEFGKELDSFSDALSFGMAPAILVYTILIRETAFKEYVVLCVSFLFVLSAILRLARFNITTVVSKEKGDFCGMPTPTAAGLISSYIIFSYALKELSAHQIISFDVLNNQIIQLMLPDMTGQVLIFPMFFLVLVIGNTLFMVSNITYKSIGKTFGLKNGIAGVIFILCLVIFNKFILFPAGFTYFLINNIKFIMSLAKRKDEPAE